MKRVIVLITTLIFFFSCKKSSNNINTKAVTNNVPNLTSYYAAKYTHLMGGERVWHRYHSFKTINSTLWDSVINFTDTTCAVTIVDNNTIIFPFPFPINGGGYLQTADSNMLKFYEASDYPLYGPQVPGEQWVAYYFPSKDSISFMYITMNPFNDTYGYSTF